MVNRTEARKPNQTEFLFIVAALNTRQLIVTNLGYSDKTYQLGMRMAQKVL